MNRLNGLILCSLIFTFSQCTTTKTTSSENQHISEPLLYVSMGACFGSCPTYDLAIYPDMSFIIENKLFTKRKGLYTGEVTEGQMKPLQEKINAVNWSSVEEYYETQIPDIPSTTLSYKGTQTQFKEGGGDALQELSSFLFTWVPELTLAKEVYVHEGEFYNRPSIKITLESGCTLDKSFQTAWKDKLYKITPLDVEGSQYDLIVGGGDYDLARAYHSLSQDRCIADIKID